MSATVPLKFYDYELRPAMPEDFDLARAWTKADPHHEGKIDPTFWIEQNKGIDTYVMKDAEGELLFLRMERTVRFYIQFAPSKGHQERSRLRKAMERGMEYLAVALSTVGIREAIFDSTSPTLRAFVAKRLNFREAPSTLTRFLPFNYGRPKAKPEDPAGTNEAGCAPAAGQPLGLQEDI